MEKISLERLLQERKDFKKSRPFGFYARPIKNSDGTLNMYKWECGIPGPEKSPWEGGLYELTLEFQEDYPSSPPKARFIDKLFHPNIYPSGSVCLSILNDEEDWKPSLRISDVLKGIQDLLKNPNEKSPAQQEAYSIYTKNRDLYNKRVKDYAKEHSMSKK